MTNREVEPVPAEPEKLPFVSQGELVASTRAKLEELRPAHNDWALRHGYPPEEFDDFVESYISCKVAGYQKARARDELDDRWVMWDLVAPDACDAFERLLEKVPTEAAAQQFLEEHPEFLVQTLGGGHGRFQKSQVRLGSEYVADFLVAEEHSMGVEWYLVELESPTMTMARADGEFRAELNHAINQIRDWRAWLGHNVDYAQRPEASGGLGLIGIDARAKGLVVAGRRKEVPARYDEFRRQIATGEHIVIHSYDWLLETGRLNLSGRLSIDLRSER